jgi:hypothetical protein
VPTFLLAQAALGLGWGRLARAYAGALRGFLPPAGPALAISDYFAAQFPNHPPHERYPPYPRRI